MCSKVVSRLVSAVKARVARLETVVSNISLAKLIERVMQVEQPRATSLFFLLVTTTIHSLFQILLLYPPRIFDAWKESKRL